MAILSMFIVAATISEFSDISPATIPTFSIIKLVLKKKIFLIDLNNKNYVLFSSQIELFLLYILNSGIVAELISENLLIVAATINDLLI